MSLPAIGGKLRRASENVVAGVSTSVITAPRNAKQFSEQVKEMGFGFIAKELGQMGRVFTDASKLIAARKADINDVTPNFTEAVWMVMLQDHRKAEQKKPVALLEYKKDM